MKTLVAYRMELELVKNCSVNLSIEVKVYDERLWCAEKSLLLSVYCESDILDSVTVKNARNQSLTTKSLDGSLSSDLAELTV